MLLLAPSTPSSVVASNIPSNNELNVTIIKGPGSTSQFVIHMQESDDYGVWTNIGTEIIQEELSGPNFVINVTLTQGNRYMAVVTSLSAAGESESQNSNEISIRK